MKMKTFCVMLGLFVGAQNVLARTVSTGTLIANPGVTVCVPVSVSSLAGASAAVVTIGYDSTVLVCLGVEAGAAADATSMTYLDSGSGRVCAVFPRFRDASGKGGELMRLRFSVRDGTQGLFSDVTLQDVQFGAKDGVTDLSASDPVTVVNGMVRVMKPTAAVKRLEEPFVVWPKTQLRMVTFAAGDALQASDDGAPVVVTDSVGASGRVPVVAPSYGWQTGRYALLKTPTAGLAFDLAGVEDAHVTAEDADGLTTYYADVRVAGSLEVVAEEGTLAAETKAQVRAALAGALAAHPDVTRIVVKGAVSEVPLIADLGIVPKLDSKGTTVEATYAVPSLAITAFDPTTGAVRIRVTPGADNAVRTALATGCLHVYGTDRLGSPMRYISNVIFDLSPYLQPATRGEADLTVALGSHTFIKVKAETAKKQEGECE